MKIVSLLFLSALTLSSTTLQADVVKRAPTTLPTTRPTNIIRNPVVANQPVDVRDSDKTPECIAATNAFNNCISQSTNHDVRDCMQEAGALTLACLDLGQDL